MKLPKSLCRMQGAELHQAYARVPGSGENGTEAEYAPLINFVRGNTRSREIRDGFYVHWANEVFDRELRVRGLEGQGYYVFTFALAGMWQDAVGARGRFFDRPAGTMALLRCEELKEHRALLTPGAMHLTIAIQQAHFMRWMTGGELEAHPRLRKFLKGEGDACLVLPLTPRARLAVEQMQNCPFHGLARSLAMEARCIDLLVEIIDQMEQPLEHSPMVKSRLLHKAERERVHEAAAHLSRHLDQPPALADLARQFHLSESKLKAGFHQVFGTTAFGYLRRLRMEKARRVLELGGASILEVSHQVGISNPSHFAAMFKGHFGVNPKQFQMNACRSR